MPGVTTWSGSISPSSRMCWVCTMVSFGGHGDDRIEVPAGLLVGQVAPAVGLPRFHQADIALQRVLQDVGAAVDLAMFLADGHLGADAGGGEERRARRRRRRACARPGCPAERSPARSCRRDTGSRTPPDRSERGKEQMILRTRPSSIRRARPIWPTPALLAGDGEVLGALLDQPVDQRVRLADGAEAAEQHGRAVLDARHGLGHGLDDLVDHARRFLSARGIFLWMLRQAQTPAKGGRMSQEKRGRRSGPRRGARSQASSAQSTGLTGVG